MNPTAIAPDPRTRAIRGTDWLGAELVAIRELLDTVEEAHAVTVDLAVEIAAALAELEAKDG